MGLFGRKRATQDEGSSLDDQPGIADVAELATDPADSVGTSEPDDLETPFSRLRGPFDESETPTPAQRLDLGALLIVPTDGLQVRLEVDEPSQSIVAVHLALGSSVAQLQAYAAPRTSGIWADIRTEIAEGVTSGQGRAEIVNGPLGKELRAVPKGGAPMRVLGVDGPRWFLRAVLSGPAATDDVAAEALVELIRGTVVVRGAEAMAPREALPLRVPEQPPAEAAPADAGAGEPGADDERRLGAQLRPFERGPEITEVR